MQPVKWQVLALSVLALILGCSDASRQPDNVQNPKVVSLNQQFNLQIGEEARIPEEGLALMLRSVPNDSRCPEDVVCVWAGNAMVLVDIVKTDQAPSTVELNTTIGATENTYLSYTVSLRSLAPAPRTGHIIAPGDYVATLLVTASSAGALEPTVKVFKTRGSVQCTGGGTAPDVMQNELIAAGIDVRSYSCGNDGMVYAAACGMPDGAINIFEIPKSSADQAQSFGFAGLSTLPGAMETQCH